MTPKVTLRVIVISIHAPRAGRDFQHLRGFQKLHSISIHAPRAGRDAGERGNGSEGYEFQSTRPVRGATAAADVKHSTLVISIHAPRAGRDATAHRNKAHFLHFNPRAPCGARHEPDDAPDFENPFQSTRPVRGATRANRGVREPLPISIHAPRAGRDADVEAARADIEISIHAPRAGRDRDFIIHD